MTANGTALATTQTGSGVMSGNEIDSLFRVSKALAMSGLFKDTRQAEQAFAKVLIGRDLGLSPTQALMGIHIIEGKPELSANLQAAFVKQAPGYDYQVVELTDERCELAFYRDGAEIGRSTFTMQDARTAGLAGRGPWKSYPRNMLFARAMSNGVAFHCPEVTGGVRTYSEGEISGDEQPPAIDDHESATPTGMPPEGQRFMTSSTEVVEPVPAAELEPPEAEVIDRPSPELVDEVRALCAVCVRDKLLTHPKLKKLLIAAGAAQDASGVNAALASMSAAQVQALRDGLTARMTDVPADVSGFEHPADPEARALDGEPQTLDAAMTGQTA